MVSPKELGLPEKTENIIKLIKPYLYTYTIFLLYLKIMKYFRRIINLFFRFFWGRESTPHL